MNKWKGGIAVGVVYYYGFDGDVADKSVITLFNLGTREIRYSKRKKMDVYNFVGCVFHKDQVLVVFPKHYVERAYIDRLNLSHEESAEDIQLLYQVIKKYDLTMKTFASAQKYIGAEDGYDADYPFAPFYRIYDYYKRYGLYKESETRIVQGNSGKVSWKDTIRKSQKVISEDNLLFIPLYVRKKNFKHVFITECMAFVIDYTLETFHTFFSMKRTGIPKTRFDYLNNIDYVIKELQRAQSEVFKDIHKKLIQDLIDFFVQYRGKAKGGPIHVKIDYFDLIWQEMVNSYLNRHFKGMKPGGQGIEFDNSLSMSPVFFCTKQYNHIDMSAHNFRIDIDHIAITADELFIFDSKYYEEMYELNYKQYSYNEILRYRYPSIKEIHNVLILPGRNVSRVHFEMVPLYAGPRLMGCKIIEQYLEPKEVMQDYIKN